MVEANELKMDLVHVTLTNLSTDNRVLLEVLSCQNVAVDNILHVREVNCVFPIPGNVTIHF